MDLYYYFTWHRNINLLSHMEIELLMDLDLVIDGLASYLQLAVYFKDAIAGCYHMAWVLQLHFAFPTLTTKYYNSGWLLSHDLPY